MADQSSVSVKGLDELKKLADALPAEVSAQLRSIAQRTAYRIMQRAKSLVPVATGYTRDNIHVIDEADKHRYVVEAGTDRPRVLISGHTSKRSGRFHTQRVTLNMLPNWIEYGTRFQVARPFMRPASDAERDQYERESTQVAEKLTEKLGQV